MKTKLKDVIHFYMGCEIQTSFRTVSMIGQPMNKAIGILVDVDLLIPDKIGVQFEFNKATLDTTTLPINSCKPILRSLSDITDAECIELSIVQYESKSKSDANNLSLGIGIVNEIIKDTWGGSHKTFMYFIKNNFDIFGLIESGQAIDKTKTKKQDK